MERKLRQKTRFKSKGQGTHQQNAGIVGSIPLKKFNVVKLTDEIPKCNSPEETFARHLR